MIPTVKTITQASASAAASILLLTSGLSPVFACDGKKLSADEITAAFVDNKMKYSGETKGVQSWTANKTKWVDKKWGPGSAKWWVSADNEYCYRYEGEDICAEVTEKEGVYTAGVYKYDSN